MGLKTCYFFLLHSLCKEFKLYKMLKSILDLPLLGLLMLSLSSSTTWLNLTPVLLLPRRMPVEVEEMIECGTCRVRWRESRIL